MALKRFYNNIYTGLLTDLPVSGTSGTLVVIEDSKLLYAYGDDNLPFLISGGGNTSTGLKKIRIAITQVGTADPSITLLENTSTLDFSDFSIVRQTEGRYLLTYQTNSQELVDRLYNSGINLDLKNSVCNIEHETGGVSKGAGSLWLIMTNRYDNTSQLFEEFDNSLDKSLFTIYESEN